MGFNIRKRVTIIHLYIPWSRRHKWNLFHIYATGSTAGVSWTFKVGPWSWNTRSRRHHVDLPGPLSWTGRSHRR